MKLQRGVTGSWLWWHVPDSDRKAVTVRALLRIGPLRVQLYGGLAFGLRYGRRAAALDIGRLTVAVP